MHALPSRALRLRCALPGIATVAASLGLLATPTPVHAAGPVVAARQSEPVVLTGSQLPQWSHLQAQCVGEPYPSGAGSPAPSQLAGGTRTAHNGTCQVPQDLRTGVDPSQISAWRWDTRGWTEVPVQVDKKFPYFLANGRSSFGIYSGTDQEVTYSWAPDAHSTGEEAWKKMWGDCTARYARSDPAGLAADLAQAQQQGFWTPGPGESPQDYTGAMSDPSASLDDDDEISFMARDAGGAAPGGAAPPAGVVASTAAIPDGQTVTLTDPLSGDQSYVYLFLRPGGSSFTWQNGYVQMLRNADADQWIDVDSFTSTSTEILGKSNRGYGPNLPGTVCTTAAGNVDKVTAADGTPRPSTDRWPRDGMTVRTPTYSLTASGRWMVRGFSVTAPDTQYQYGPSLVARWKGRAFQSSPDSQVSVVGFEDEQINWEGNSALLGWKVGPVRAIREIWGADSGTNVTKTEYYYRDADVFSYHVRVHPIPPDGLYTSWSYNLGTASTYYNLENPGGVAIDGVNDNVGYIDQVPVTGTKAYFNACDPAFDVCSAVDRPEEVAGKGADGGLVYIFQFTGATSALNPAAVPYYRDDACFDDGTGDSPVPRQLPGDDSGSQQVHDAYTNWWRQRIGNASLQYSDLKCDPGNTDATVPEYKKTPFSGAIGEHGIHFFATWDSDNLWQQQPIDELDGEQWRFSVPMAQPTNVLQQYGANVISPLQAAAVPYGTPTPATVIPEVVAPWMLVPGAMLGAVAVRRRRSLRR